jgi:hypothetical protein
LPARAEGGKAVERNGANIPPDHHLRMGHAMAEATQTLPHKLPKGIPAEENRRRIPSTIERAMAKGWRLMAEAARYGDQPLPAQLKARLDRCAEEQRHLLTTARRKTQRRREPGRWMMCASGLLGQIGRH